MIEPAARAYAEFFENLSPASLAHLGDVFRSDARFRDPFNDVTGIAGIEAVFRHLFATLDDPRFEVSAWAARGDTAYYHWRFSYGSESDVRDGFDGMSRVRFDATGRAVEHVDYWDPTGPCYRRIPLLGAVIALVVRRLRAPSSRDVVT